jgi:hypothetical protein
MVWTVGTGTNGVLGLGPATTQVKTLTQVVLPANAFVTRISCSKTQTVVITGTFFY